MMDNGIGSDMLSLGLPPLHTAPFFMYVKEHQAVGSDGIDSAQSYFEVPHWMHLSFVSYESDAQLPTEKKANEEEARESAIMARGRIEVGPNGFIRRHWVEGLTSLDGHLNRQRGVNTPASTPSVASPIKQRKEVPKERQLIAGRDFSDILRASRPRFSASLPAPFRLLLKSQGRETAGTNKSREESVSTNHSGSKNIREWNCTESDDASDASIHLRGRGVSLGHDPRDGTSPVIFPKSPPRVDMLDILDRGSSPSSSFTTHLSLGGLASSLERQHEFMPRHQLSPKLTGMQLQRARSLEFQIEENEESETIESDRSLFSNRQYAGYEPRDSDLNRMIKSVEELMKACDAASLMGDSPKAIAQPAVDSSRHSAVEMSTGRKFRTTNLSKSPKFGPRNISTKSIPTQGTGQVGGIGEALSQYRGSATSLSSDTDNSGGGAAISRVSSYGRFPNNALLRIPEMLSAGMSPLLLPPTETRREIPPDTIHLESRSKGADRRFVDVHRVGSADAFIRPQRGRQSDSSPGSDRRLHSLISSSPPKPALSSGVNLSALPASSKRSYSRTSKKKKAFNPFRQQDEDAVLAEKSHNRRRWSHVFPVTEIEFKRHVSHKGNDCGTVCISLIIFITGRTKLEKSVRSSYIADFY